MEINMNEISLVRAHGIIHGVKKGNTVVKVNMMEMHRANIILGDLDQAAGLKETAQILKHVPIMDLNRRFDNRSLTLSEAAIDNLYYSSNVGC